MYHIYLDEAGTCADELVSIVVAVTVRTGSSLERAELMLSNTFDALLPEDVRQGFVFHAKQIWAGYHDQNSTWLAGARAHLIGSVAAIPRLLGATVTVGKVRRDAEAFSTRTLEPHEFQQMMAFHACLARANKFVRDFGEATEQAVVVVEDIAAMRRAVEIARTMPVVDLPLDPKFIQLTEDEKKTGQITQSVTGPIDRIVHEANFTKKGDTAFLQIANACAFTFFSYLSKESFSGGMVRAMLGSDLVWDDWQGPSSDMNFVFDPEVVRSKRPRAGIPAPDARS